MIKTTRGPRIEVVVDKQGNAETTVHEVPGTNCHAVSASIEACFGAVTSTQSTIEAFEAPEEVKIKAKQGDG
jgi:hypothetical protein